MSRPNTDQTEVDYTASASSLAQQLEKAQRRIADLEAELKATRALDQHLAIHGRNTDDPALLTRIAAALLLANEAEKALQAVDIDAEGRVMRTQTTGFREPGAATRSARHHVRMMRKDLLATVERFETAAEHNWHPPKKDQIPTVRCRIRGCPAEGVNVDAWRHVRGGKTIYAEKCSSCGTPYPTPDQETNP